MKHSAFCCGLVVGMALASFASAEILTAENAADICTAMHEGKPAVDPDRLALLIVTEARASRYLDGANQAGLRNNSIELTSSASVLSEPAYALVHYGDAAALASRPFGPTVDLRADKAAAAARDRIDAVVGQELVDVLLGQQKTAGSVTYSVMRRADVPGAPTEKADLANPALLFDARRIVVITCGANGTGPFDGASSATPTTVVAKRRWPVQARLRGNVKDLTVGRESLTSAKPATISFLRDDKSDTETVALNGVLGLRAGDEGGRFEGIGFVSYENQAVTGDANDVEKISPGLLLGYKIETSTFALHSRLEASYVRDLEQDSEQGKLRVYADPGFSLGAGRGQLFGTYLGLVTNPENPLRVLQLRPDLTIIVDATDVFDRGQNAALADASSYFGFGGNLSLRVRLNLGSPISDFGLEGGLRQLWLAGDIDKDAATRWYASLNYAPESFPYLGISLSCYEGENEDTLQAEEVYSAGINLRY